MNITINTDASFCNSLKKGAFAYWISYTEGPKKGIGHFKIANDINYCEMKAILIAIKTSNTIAPFIITQFTINTDSQVAIDMFTKKNYSKEYAVLIKHFVKLTKGIKIKFNKVKSHTKITGKREFINNWCDVNARQRLNHLRKKYKCVL